MQVLTLSRATIFLIVYLAALTSRSSTLWASSAKICTLESSLIVTEPEETKNFCKEREENCSCFKLPNAKKIIFKDQRKSIFIFNIFNWCQIVLPLLFHHSHRRSQRLKTVNTTTLLTSNYCRIKKMLEVTVLKYQNINAQGRAMQSGGDHILKKIRVTLLFLLED